MSSNIYVDPATGKMQQGQSGSYTEPIEKYNSNPAKTPTLNTPPSAGSGVDTYHLAPPTPDPSVVYNPDGTRSAVDQYWDQNQPLSNPDFASQQEKTKQDFLKQQQEAIDSINNMYVGIINQANQQGTERVGSTNVINALSGQRGAPTGAANVDKTVANNNAIMESINAEKNAKINTVMNNFQSQLRDELKNETDLRTTNTDSWLTYMSGKEDKQKQKGLDLRKQLIDSKIEPTDITDNQWQQMADATGYTVDEFKTLYNAELKQNKNTWLADEQKRLADLAKTQAETEKIKNEAAVNSQKDYNDLKKSLIEKGYKYISDSTQLKGLAEDQITRVTDANGTERIFALPQDKHSSIYTEWQDYKSTGGKLNFDAYQTMDANRKKSVSNTNIYNTKTVYSGTTIPANIKTDLLADIKAGNKIEDVMAAYSEVDTAYIQSLYPKKKTSLFGSGD